MAPWKGFVAAAILAAFAPLSGVTAAEPNAKRQAEIAALVGDLGHEEFALREAAVERLVLAGPDAFEALLAAAQSQNTEVAWRATSALEQINPKLTGVDLQRTTKSLSAVDTARHPHLAPVIADLQSRGRNLRRHEVVGKIRELGGATSKPDGLEQALRSPPPAPEAVRRGEPISPDEVAPVSTGTAEPKIMAIPAAQNVPARLVAARIQAAPVAPAPVPPAPEAAIVDLAPAGPEQAFVAEQEAFDLAGDPAPPPDFLPTTPAGEVPALGGDIADAFVGDVEIGGAGPVDPKNLAADPVTSLWLTSTWRGGDEGLALLKELPELGELNLIGADVTDAGLAHVVALPNLSYLKVYRTRITSDGLRKLRSQRPSLTIIAVGRTAIGLSAEVADERCRVSKVNADSGAAAAGLQEGDYITRVDEVNVTSFVDLMIAAFDRQPGDKLNVQYERDGEVKTALVELRERTSLPAILQ